MKTAFVSAITLVAGAASGQTDIVGGATSVALDTATLSAAAGLDLSGVSAGVGAGELPDSVAFPINTRDASSPLLPTTFSYNAGDFLGSFGGTIEHEGSVFFNADTIEVGNFTIGFDAGRVGGSRSGFFVESTTGINAILFDVAAPSLLDPTATGLIIEADLLVSSEFATFLGDAGLTGADVGDARVNAVPAPATAGLLGAVGLAAARRRR